MTKPEAEFQDLWLKSLSEKTSSLASKIKAKLTAAEEKILAALKKIAKTFRKYWQFLILSGKILVFVAKKIREGGYLNCEKN